MQLEFNFELKDPPLVSVSLSEPREETLTMAACGGGPCLRVLAAPRLALHDAAEAFRAELARRTGLEVDLTVTNNRSRMISFAVHPGKHAVTLRLHHMFFSGGPEIASAVAHWIQHPRSRKSAGAIDGFIRDNRCQIRAARPRNRTLTTRGKFFDLHELFCEVNREHFDETVKARITWGAMPRLAGKRRRSIRFGSHSWEDDIIRVHPLLDQPFVPRFFVRYIVFHEMLHAHLGFQESAGPGGRRRVHTREFRRIEEAYPDYARAVAWQDDPANLQRLLGHAPARRGKPFATLLPRWLR